LNPKEEMNREEEIFEALEALRETNEIIDAGKVKELVEAKLKERFPEKDPKRELPQSWEVMYQRTVRTLLAAKVLKILGESEVIWSEDQPQTKPDSSSNSDKNDGSVLAPGSSGNEGNNEGNGFRAVLAHPYLFALPLDEFNDLLKEI
jgi:hypothetical protein